MAADITSYFVIFLGVWALWRACHLVRGGAMGKDSWEHRGAIADVNLVRRLRGLPPQQEMTREQMRAYGWVYALLAGVLLVGGVLTAVGVLH